MITHEQEEALTNLLAEAEDSPHLTPWEREFSADLNKRLIEWGPRLNVSIKQWDIFERIKKKLNDAGIDV